MDLRNIFKKNISDFRCVLCYDRHWLMPVLWSPQAVCIDVFKCWGYKEAYMPSFCVLVSSEAVTGPHCSINDCTDKRAVPSGTLVHNPFPEYPPSRTWCIFFPCNVYLTQAGRRRKAILGAGALWGLVWFVSLACQIFLTLVMLYKNLWSFSPQHSSLHRLFLPQWCFPY